MKNFNFITRPVKAYDENDDGTPACVEECPLHEAQWIGIYRENLDHETTDAKPSDWVFDVDISGHGRREAAVEIAEGLCELLNAITPAEALNNPKLHVFFE